MAKVQETIEDGLSGVRDDLGRMERDVESLNSLLFQADVFLAEPGTALQHGLNPREALTHVSNLFSSYQAELIRLREVLADFTTETIGPEAFSDEWRVMKEVDKGSQEECGGPAFHVQGGIAHQELFVQVERTGRYDGLVGRRIGRARRRDGLKVLLPIQ